VRRAFGGLVDLHHALGSIVEKLIQKLPRTMA